MSEFTATSNQIQPFYDMAKALYWMIRSLFGLTVRWAFAVDMDSSMAVISG